MWEIDDDWTGPEVHLSKEQLTSLAEQLSPTPPPFFLVRSAQNNTVETASVNEFSTFFTNVPQESVRSLISCHNSSVPSLTTICSKLSVFWTLLRKLPLQGGPCVTSLRTSAPCIQRRRRPSEYYAGAVMPHRVASAFYAVAPPAQTSRARSDGKRTYKEN